MSNIIKAIKNIYPTIEGGFVYWETKQDGTPWESPIDGLIWENTEFTKPLWSDIELKISAIKLAEAKDSKIAEISAIRETVSEKSTVTYNTKDYANSQNARVAILRRVTSLNDTDTKVYFTYPDQEVVNLDKADFEAIATLIEDNELLARQTEGSLIAQVNACTTIEEVNNINVDFS